MKKLFLFLIVACAFSAAAVAQEFSEDPYEFILAKLAAQDARYDEALSRMDKVLARNPDNTVLQFERAMILIDASRLDAAEGALRKVTTARPDFYDAQRVLGRLLLDRAGADRAKVDEALSHLQAAFRINPDDIGTGMAVAQILLSTGRTADAEKVLAALLERAPDQRTLNYTYAQVLTKLGRGDESRQFLERAVQVDPTFGPAILQLIDIYQKENEWQKAADVMQPLINDDPLNLDLQRQQAFFYLRGGMPEKARVAFKSLTEADPKDTRSQFYLAEALNDLEQYAEADKIYRGLLEKTPGDPDVLASYGLSQIGQRRLDEAAKTFNLLLGVPDLPENLQVLAKTQLAYIDLQKGNYAAALDDARPILVFRDKPNAQAINIALDALKKQKRYSDAVQLLQPLVDNFASDPFVNARYVEMLIRSGATDRAKLAATTQAKFGTKNTIASAEAYLQTEQYEPAIAMVRDALKNKPDEIDLQFELGSAYERSGDKKAAERVFLDILEKHPEHAATLNYLGYMWAEGGVNLERAAEMLNRAVKQEPRNGAYVDSLGWVYFRQGKLELAEKYLTDATHLLPRDATVHEHLGDVLAKRGDVHRALDLYRAALTLEPEPKDEAKLRVKIAELERQQAAAQR
ncbi:MAG TPA: tetratricopeptide repeat protein [Thermoanaerobaculia bacterium]